MPGELQPADIIFGKFKQAKYDILNHAIMYAKYYIHKQFVQEKRLRSTGFVSYYKQALLIEKQRYIEKQDLANFMTRFGKTSLLEDIKL